MYHATNFGKLTISSAFLTLVLFSLCDFTRSGSNPDQQLNANEIAARGFLKEYNVRAMEVFYELNIAGWKYECDINDYTKQNMVRSIANITTWN